MISVFKVKKHDISQEIKKEILYTYIVYEIYLVKVCPPSIYEQDHLTALHTQEPITSFRPLWFQDCFYTHYLAIIATATH